MPQCLGYTYPGLGIEVDEPDDEIEEELVMRVVRRYDLLRIGQIVPCLPQDVAHCKAFQAFDKLAARSRDRWVRIVDLIPLEELRFLQPANTLSSA